MRTGYYLIPVIFGTCDAAGENISVNKYDDAIIINSFMSTIQDLNNKLATGYYTVGWFRYEGNTGVASNKLVKHLQQLQQQLQ